MMRMIRRGLGSIRRALGMDRYSCLAMGGGASGSQAVATGTLRPAEHAIMVFGCLSARRDAIASVPAMLTDAEGNPVEHPAALRLLASPSRGLSWDQHIRAIETYLALYDAAAILPIGDPVDELILLHPAGLKAVMGAHAQAGTPAVLAWEYTDPTTGRQKNFSPDEVIVNFGFNPHAPLAPLSPLNVLRATIEADLTARQMNLTLAKNDATPPLALKTTQPMTKDQADEVRDQWNSLHQGVSNRGKVAVLWGGLDITKLSLTPAEMEYIAGLKFLKSDYYIAFRVRPAMVADLSGETGLSQGNSGSKQKVEWWEDVGLAELSLIASMHQPIFDRLVAAPARPARTGRAPLALARHLRRAARAADSPGAFLWFNDGVIPALAENRLTKIAQLKDLVGLGWTPDDVSTWLDLGLPPHPTNVATLPMNLIPASDLANSAPARPVAASGEPVRSVAAPDALTRALGALEGAVVRAAAAAEEAPSIPARFRAAKARFDRLAEQRIRAAARRWSRYFVEQRGRVLERAKQIGLARGGSLARANVGQILDELFPMGAENEELVKRLAPIWTEHLRDGWELTADQVGGKFPSFQIEDPRIREALKARSIQGSKVNETTREELRAILEQALDDGATVTEIGDRVAEYYAENIGESAARPMLAARTQLAGIVNDGQMAAARSAGNLMKSWLHGGSNEPRAGHLRAQTDYVRNPIGLDEKFVVNGFECDAPGDAGLPVEEVANCTCMVVFETATGSEEQA